MADERRRFWKQARREALRLIDVSKASLYNDTRNGRGADQTVSSRIYDLIRGMRESGAAAVGRGARGEMDLKRIRELVLAKGFTNENFEKERHALKPSFHDSLPSLFLEKLVSLD